MRKVIGFLGTLFVAGCAIASPTTITQLKSNQPNRTEIYRSTYQSLAKCWQENATPTYLDFKRNSELQVFTELGVAQVTTGFSLFEFTRLPDGTTRVDSYDNFIHRQNHKEWFDVLMKCDKGN